MNSGPGNAGRTGLTNNDYSVGWVTTLPVERAAALAMLDEIHKKLPRERGDTNNYAFGRIGDHNIVIASLPDDGYGTINAATVAGNMRRTFPSLEVFLMVGIAGGAPGGTDIRLGDVVVSTKVLQYDLGKALEGDRFQVTAIPCQPSQELRMAVSALRAQHELEPSIIPDFLRQMAEQRPHMEDYTCRNSLEDLLFESTYDHHGSEPTCNKCDRSRLVERTLRDNSHPVIHYGIIASGDQVIKYAKKRDELAQQFKVLCFETEGAGLIESLQCLVIRSISNYADSHKNKQWQRYAAATAAAYTKELLSEMAAVKTKKYDIKPSTIEALMSSLYFESIATRELNITPAYGKTCEWILGHPDYSAWLDLDKHPQNHGFLWIRGKPGAGKSTLMKFIYTRLGNDYNAISFSFNARGNILDQSIEGMFRSLLLQLFEQFPDLQWVLEHPHLLRKASGGSIKWDISTLQDVLSRAIAQLGQRQLMCFIDALDARNENEVYRMVEYFEQLEAFASEKNVKLFTCFSSQCYPSIPTKTNLTLTIEDQDGHGRDLNEYVDHKLDVAKGEQALEIRRMRKKLNETPAKLSELFKHILKNTTRTRMNSYYPCNRYFMLNVPIIPRGQERTTIEHTKDFVSNSSKGVAEVAKSFDSKVALINSTVQFIHKSVRDFFLRDISIMKGYNRLKKCCHAYIQARAVGIHDFI
ncbi:nucleoside phosphorylase domain-containing protein [Xylaria digitata]|nr:nucleoside phosphorylase domain-containing protein [Xylaria digitata]